MEQKNIREFGGTQYTKEEGAALIKELDDRTKSNHDGYNSISELAEKVKANVYAVNVIDTDTNAVKKQLYVFKNDSTLTLTTNPTEGDWVEVSNLSDTPSPTVARNGKKILGIAEDLVIDKAYVGFRLVYTGATYGWTIIG